MCVGYFVVCAIGRRACTVQRLLPQLGAHWPTRGHVLPGDGDLERVVQEVLTFFFFLLFSKAHGALKNKQERKQQVREGGGGGGGRRGGGGNSNALLLAAQLFFCFCLVEGKFKQSAGEVVLPLYDSL